MRTKLGNLFLWWTNHRVWGPAESRRRRIFGFLLCFILVMPAVVMVNELDLREWWWFYVLMIPCVFVVCFLGLPVRFGPYERVDDEST